MGMYTELHFNAELKSDLDPGVYDLLRYMTGQSETEPAALPDHELFEGDRWRFMLQCDSYYFPAVTCSRLYLDRTSRDSYYLCIRCNLKNYEGEIEAFLDWVRPHLWAFEGDFLGFHRYEGTETPTLIYA